MALDLYVGPLSRWWAGAWKTEGEAAGATTIRAADDAPRIGDARAIVKEWQKALKRQLALSGADALAWSESAKSVWLTSRIGWEAYGSLLVFAAREEHAKTPCPRAPVSSWRTHAAYRASVRKGAETRYRHILQPELWLPGDMPIVFRWIDPTTCATTIGSVAALRRQLRELNSRTWKARAGDVARWRRAAPRSFEGAARRGFAELSALAGHAEKYGLPLRLDF